MLRTSPAATNWIRDLNRFALADPPKWWLQALTDFDPLLVLTTSRQHPVYILARKAKRNPILDEKERLSPDRDVRMLASQQLIYVSVLQGTGLDQAATVATFTTGIFNELRRRDILHHGGWQKCVKTMEEFEDADRAEKIAACKDEEEQRDKAAYQHLKRRVGERLQAPGPTASGSPHSTL